MAGNDAVLLDWKVAESAEAAANASSRPEAELDHATAGLTMTGAVMMLSTSVIAASMLF